MPGAARRLILGSASPQRREILARLGLEFEVIVSDVDEVSGGDPAADVLINARRKATAVWELIETDPSQGPPVVIACDTDVVHEGRILGKPADEAEAGEYLRSLSGRTHEVISALVILGLPNADPSHSGHSENEVAGESGESARLREGLARSQVRFRELDEHLIRWYVDTGEWRGRAGGYAIQGFGTTLVAGVDGDVSNVIGLPVPVLIDLAAEIFG